MSHQPTSSCRTWSTCLAYECVRHDGQAVGWWDNSCTCSSRHHSHQIREWQAENFYNHVTPNMQLPRSSNFYLLNILCPKHLWEENESAVSQYQGLIECYHCGCDWLTWMKSYWSDNAIISMLQWGCPWDWRH